MADKGVFNPDLKVGMLVQSTSGWRGWISCVSETADKWPYTVRTLDRKSELFAARNLKIVRYDPIMWEKVNACIALAERIQTMKRDLAVLETAHRVLEMEIEPVWLEDMGLTQE